MDTLNKAIQKGEAYLKANGLKVERNRVCPTDGEVRDLPNNHGESATCAYTKEGNPFLFVEYLRSQFQSPLAMAEDGYIPLADVNNLETPWIPESYLA